MIRTQFLMTLRPSNSLLTGQFEIIESESIGESLFKHSVLKAYPATSGIAGYQTEDHFWTRGRGPIPRSLEGKREYTLNIKGRYSVPTKGIEGLAYPISPDPIRQIGGNGMRSEVMLHRDANVPGSAGCIVLCIDETEFKEFNAYIWSICRDMTKVPLLVKYL